MNRFGIGCALSLVVACNNKPPEDEPEESGIYGILELDSPQTGEAEVEVFRAFSYIDDGKLIAFLSSNFSTTCDDAAAYLAPDFPVEKDSILRAGTCATTLFLPSYNGRSDEVGPATDVDPGESRSSVIECAMGGGVFELEDFDDGSGEDYTWSGKWFEGVPLQYDWLIEGTAGEKTFIQLDMQTVRGSLPYSGSPEVVTATGEVKGSIFAEYCPQLQSALLMQ